MSNEQNLFDAFESFDPSNLDMDSIEMISKAMNAFSNLKNAKDDSRCNLLHAIKPHLSGKRADEIENCVKLLKMTAVLSAIKKE